MASLGVFAVGFLGRPVGAIVIGATAWLRLVVAWSLAATGGALTWTVTVAFLSLGITALIAVSAIRIVLARPRHQCDGVVEVAQGLTRIGVPAHPREAVEQPRALGAGCGLCFEQMERGLRRLLHTPPKPHGKNPTAPPPKRQMKKKGGRSRPSTEERKPTSS